MAYLRQAKFKKPSSWQTKGSVQVIDFAWLAVASALLAALLIVIAMTRNGPQDIRRTRI